VRIHRVKLLLVRLLRFVAALGELVLQILQFVDLHLQCLEHARAEMQTILQARRGARSLRVERRGCFDLVGQLAGEILRLADQVLQRFGQFIECPLIEHARCEDDVCGSHGFISLPVARPMR